MAFTISPNLTASYLASNSKPKIIFRYYLRKLVKINGKNTCSLERPSTNASKFSCISQANSVILRFIKNWSFSISWWQNPRRVLSLCNEDIELSMLYIIILSIFLLLSNKFKQRLWFKFSGAVAKLFRASFTFWKIFVDRSRTGLVKLLNCYYLWVILLSAYSFITVLIVDK